MSCIGEHQARGPGPPGAAGESAERRPSCHAIRCHPVTGCRYETSALHEVAIPIHDMNIHVHVYMWGSCVRVGPCMHVHVHVGLGLLGLATCTRFIAYSLMVQIPGMV